MSGQRDQVKVHGHIKTFWFVKIDFFKPIRCDFQKYFEPIFSSIPYFSVLYKEIDTLSFAHFSYSTCYFKVCISIYGNLKQSIALLSNFKHDFIIT